MDAKVDERVLTITRHLKGSPEKIFDAWTVPEKLVQWWGPEGYTTPEHDMDVRVGGKWTTTMVGPEGSHTCFGVFRKLDRPRGLAFTWAWRQPDGTQGHETLVEVDLEPEGGGTLMTFRQSTFADVEQRDAHNKGWQSSFSKLEKLVA